MAIRSVTASAGAIAALGLGATPIVALGFADGGFYPRPWGWAALGLACTAVAVALARRELIVSRRAVVLLCLLVALGLWIAASLVWTRSTGLTVFELQRLLVYATGVGAAALLIQARTAHTLAVGVFLGTGSIAVWGLVSYLLTREHVPDMFQGSYLHRPLGYANAMAIVAVMAILLALGLLTESSSRPVRTGAGVALVPLASALALTGSRAGWAAFVVGAGISVALTSRRTGTIRAWASVLVLPGAAVLLVTSAGATSSQIVGSRADDVGNRLLVAILALTALALFPALFIARSPVGSTRPTGRRGPHLTPILILVSLGAFAALALGASRLELAGDRPTLWRVAADEFEARPLLGSGAGTYAQVWFERRPVETSVRDAHSILIEALSDLGIVGLVLVCMLLGTPLVWGARSRAGPLVPAATGAFGAYAAHAAVDWDWEMPAVTLAALFCACTIAVATDRTSSFKPLAAAPRGAAVALGIVAAVVALAGFTGASALEDASRALAREDLGAADRAARRAERWQPWSVEPLLTRGRASLALGDRTAARVFFVRAVRRDPRDYRAWLALAAVSRGDAAQMAVARARELNPKAVRGA